MIPANSSSHDRCARLAVVLATSSVATHVWAFGLFGMVWATSGSADRVEALTGVGYVGGVLLSLVAFGLATRARLGRAGRSGRAGRVRGRGPRLWLPLSLFPALLAVWALAVLQTA